LLYFLGDIYAYHISSKRESDLHYLFLFFMVFPAALNFSKFMKIGKLAKYLYLFFGFVVFVVHIGNYIIVRNKGGQDAGRR